MSDTDLGALAVELRLACMRISRRVRFEAQDDEWHIPPHQFSVLARLDKADATPSELAEAEKVSAPSMTRTVAGLVEAGLVTRAAHPGDRRAVVLSLTGSGRELLTQIKARRDLWMASRLAELSDDERRTLAEATPLLARVAAR